MIYIVLGLIGAAMGSAYLFGRGGFLLGGIIGLLTAAVINQRNRFVGLEKRLASLEKRLPATEKAPGPSDAAGIPGMDRGAFADAGKGVKTSGSAKDLVGGPASNGRTAAPPPPVTEMPSLEMALPDEGGAASPSLTALPPDPPPPAPPGPGDQLRAFFLGGNLMVRVGVVVLLFGFAFLVKYAAARNLVPLELRLSAAMIAGIGLLLLGWRLRDSRMGYAVALQGGGIGVMYLTLFAAARLFHLVPILLTLGVLAGLVGFSGVLAILQDSVAMAVLGAAGGFLAPVLLSTGTGSHVMLFSYYALLNAGIFGIAWFKAWRWLNLLGFVFTFGIGSIWGLRYYRPAYFSTTEPFLILFFVYYLSISVLFALRQPPRLKGYVDGTLVFGMPLVVFSLQVGLVKNMTYGLAFSAVTLGLIYTGAATLLWRRRKTGLDALVEAFLALGVIFGSLAIPLALSGSWTAVTWSLEGAGLVWVGLRQRRWTARCFGVLLQIGSGLIFLFGRHGGGTVFFNSHFMGGMMVGVAGLFCAFFLERYRQRLHWLEKPFGAVLMTWGLLWWFGTGLGEIERWLHRRYELAGSLAFIGLSAQAMGLLYHRLDWRGIRWPALGLLPVMALATATLLHQYDFKHPFQDGWILVWPLTLGVHYYLLRRMETNWNGKIATAWHVGGILLVTVLLSGEAAWLLDRLARGARIWRFIAWGAVPAIVVTVLGRFRAWTGWPLGSWKNAYQGWLPFLLVLGLLAWTLIGGTVNGNPAPLPFLPLLNPLDLAQMFVFLVIIGWLLKLRKEPLDPAAKLSPMQLWTGPLAGVFFWLTAVVARSVHHMAAVPYSSHAMFHSHLFQAAIAVLWGLLSLGCMVASNRLKHRTGWFVGAGLLAVVVVKLFAVDLSGSGTISRIVSFLAVGGLMLVIGFFTPLPPAASKGGRA